ncbi:MAG TPA: flippase [Ktedonobacteraceae bacterium]|nr:flippase [Ktedonobacteraceae bacterium]
MEKNQTLDPKSLTTGRLLANNVIWNFLGALAPAICALVCLPIMKHSLGMDRLGIITLAFVIVGYFSLFDFGLGRALTKMVAERVGQRSWKEIPALIWASLFLMLIFGLLGAALGFEFSPWYVYRVIKIPPTLQHEALVSFYWLSASLPVVVITAGLRGILEAVQEFRLATIIRIPIGIFTYLGPVLVIPLSHSVASIVAVLVVARLLACIGYFFACFAVLPDMKRVGFASPASVLSLLRFGAWMTVSNAVSPLMLWFDRFVIAAMVSVSAAAYYAIPNEVVIRLTIVPYALLGVLFPAFSTASAHDPERLGVLWQATLRYIFIAQFPIILLLIAFAPQWLHVWLGADFAQNSSLVARWLLAAILINSVATVPYSHLQSIGRPDITAKLQVIELFLYAGVLFVLARRFGINGVAVAWFLRMAFEAIFVFYFSARFLPSTKPAVARLSWMLAATMVAFVIIAATGSMEIRVALAAVICLGGMLIIWFWIFSARERQFLVSSFLRRSSLGS